jgi:nucleotide-binding universal stress UspA family protein
MSQTFIAAYDGSAAARAAVAFAVELAAEQDAEVVAAHVYPALKPIGLRGSVVDKEMQTSLHDSGRAVLDGLDDDGVSRRILLAGSPAQALHELAEDEHASLIAVGVTHRRHVGRVTPGSVGSNLLHGAPCPVLVVPAGREPGPVHTIVVAYDEGAQSRSALERAVQLARQHDARLIVVAAYEPEVFAGPAMIAASDLDQLLRGELRTRVQADVEALNGVAIETRVVPGPAAEVIAEQADGADLIVIGSRGYGPQHSVLVGGVSRKLVDNAPCPVLVVPRVPEPTADTVVATGAAGATAQPA